MSVSYSAAPTHDPAEDSECEVLLYGKTPASVRIESYIPARKRTIVFDIGILFGLFIIFAVTVGLISYYVILPLTRSKTDKDYSTPGHGWINSYPRFGSESVMRLLDVNGDGADDAIFGVAQLSDSHTIISQPQYCQQYAKGCLAAVLAIDGKTGQQLWNISCYNEIFVLNCGNIDINKDGEEDCVGAGRLGSFIAFDPRKGSLLWTPQTGSESYIEYAWNIYNPLVIDDFTGDGVPEVLLAHGGNPEYPPEEMKRDPGRTILMDGAKGYMIGRYLDMPDGRETYNSPVLHRDKKGVKYVLIGTGGETAPGSLFVARVKDLVAHMKSAADQRSDIAPVKQLTAAKNGPYFQLYKGRRKGVMVPVVLADVNRDECEDIITTSFDGVLLAFDGDSFRRLWSFEDDGAESYTTPGIGYFNNDEYLDFMMHWNYGIWPDYKRSAIMVHSGKDGKVLWTFNTTRFSMTSDLVIRTYKPHQDMFVFRVQGRMGTPLDSGLGVMHGIDPQRNPLKTTAKPTRAKRDGSLSCDMSDSQYDALAAEVFIVDWETKDAPRRVFRRDVDKYHYDVGNGQNFTNPSTSIILSKIHPERYVNTSRCAIMEQSSRTTGAIADTNNDGKLDLVLTYNAQGVIKDIKNNYARVETSLDLVVVELEKGYKNYPALTKAKTLVKLKKASSAEVKWKATSHQIWTGYMGHDSLSKYPSPDET